MSTHGGGVSTGVAQTAPQLYCQLIAAGLGDADLRRIRDACTMAVHDTLHLVRGSGKPFSCHLVGVASLVLEVTQDADLVVAALLHATYQPRVSGGSNDASANTRETLQATLGTAVERLLHGYQTAGPLLPGAALASATGTDRAVRILQLADLLEDGLDGGPWWHGIADADDNVKGSAGQRVSQLRESAALFAQAPALGAGSLLGRYEAVLAEWEQGVWPESLRSGRYSTYKPSADATLP